MDWKGAIWESMRTKRKWLWWSRWEIEWQLRYGGERVRREEERKQSKMMAVILTDGKEDLIYTLNSTYQNLSQFPSKSCHYLEVANKWKVGLQCRDVPCQGRMQPRECRERHCASFPGCSPANLPLAHAFLPKNITSKRRLLPTSEPHNLHVNGTALVPSKVLLLSESCYYHDRY